MAQSVDELKAALKEISKRRAEIEQEIAVRTARLEATGVGLQGPLVDKEGFPRADVDVSAIRADRHHVIVMSNDHKALTSQMEQLLYQLHARSREPGAPSQPAAASQASSAAAPQQQPAVAAGPMQLTAPFALVDEVSPGSPASLAGIQLGDQLVRFGDVTAEAAPSTLQQVAVTLQAHEGMEVEAVFLRHGAPVTLRLTPRQWAGRGLLGCHLRPL